MGNGLHKITKTPAGTAGRTRPGGVRWIKWPWGTWDERRALWRRLLYAPEGGGAWTRWLIGIEADKLRPGLGGPPEARGEMIEQGLREYAPAGWLRLYELTQDILRAGPDWYPERGR